MTGEFDPTNSKYGVCEKCKSDLKPVWFREDEIIYKSGIPMKTGRSRNAVSHLICTNCLRQYCVDDSFDKEWH